MLWKPRQLLVTFCLSFRISCPRIPQKYIKQSIWDGPKGWSCLRFRKHQRDCNFVSVSRIPPNRDMVSAKYAEKVCLCTVMRSGSTCDRGKTRDSLVPRNEKYGARNEKYLYLAGLRSFENSQFLQFFIRRTFLYFQRVNCQRIL